MEQRPSFDEKLGANNVKEREIEAELPNEEIQREDEEEESSDLDSDETELIDIDFEDIFDIDYDLDNENGDDAVNLEPEEEENVTHWPFYDSFNNIPSAYDDDDNDEASNDSSSTSQITPNKSMNVDDHRYLVVKRLWYEKDGNEWEAYLTLDKKENPTKLCLKDSNLFIDGETVSKKLIIDGDLEVRYDMLTERPKKIASSLLKKYVHACNLTDVYLQSQKISWMKYEKLVHGGNVKIFHFDAVRVKKKDGGVAHVEDIMEKLPNVRYFEFAMGCDGSSNITKETFAKLPYFKNLKVFILENISNENFDPDSFIEFMEDHPRTRFYLSFRYILINSNRKRQVDAIAGHLRDAEPYRNQLKIERNL